MGQYGIRVVDRFLMKKNETFFSVCRALQAYLSVIPDLVNVFTPVGKFQHIRQISEGVADFSNFHQPFRRF